MGGLQVPVRARSRSRSPAPAVVISGKGRFMMDEREQQLDAAMRSRHTSPVRDTSYLNPSLVVPTIQTGGPTPNTSPDRNIFTPQQEDHLNEKLRQHADGHTLSGDTSYLNIPQGHRRRRRSRSRSPMPTLNQPNKILVKQDDAITVPDDKLPSEKPHIDTSSSSKEEVVPKSDASSLTLVETTVFEFVNKKDKSSKEELKSSKQTYTEKKLTDEFDELMTLSGKTDSQHTEVNMICSLA